MGIDELKLEGKYNYLVKDDEMWALYSDIVKLREDLSSLSASISSLRETIENGNQWEGNGKDELVAFLKLNEQLSLYIAGDNSEVLMGMTGSKLDEKKVYGGADHINNMLVAIKQFLDAVSTLEKGSTCLAVQSLNSIQGETYGQY